MKHLRQQRQRHWDVVIIVSWFQCYRSEEVVITSPSRQQHWVIVIIALRHGFNTIKEEEGEGSYDVMGDATVLPC